jgi:hypothetical protein
MECQEEGCEGTIEEGVCNLCGMSAVEALQENLEDIDDAERLDIFKKVRGLLEPREVAPSRQGLLSAAHQLKKVFPYNYDAWRLHADLLMSAINQLETRQLQPDASFTLFTIPLREDDLRDAAEAALRECAHFADSDEKRIALIDQANRVRRLTWS